MPEPRLLKPTDPCPACNGALVKARVPSEADEKRARDVENPIVLPPDMDTAPPDQRADLGALFRCAVCGYQARFALAAV